MIAKILASVGLPNTAAGKKKFYEIYPDEDSYQMAMGGNTKPAPFLPSQGYYPTGFDTPNSNNPYGIPNSQPTVNPALTNPLYGGVGSYNQKFGGALDHFTDPLPNFFNPEFFMKQGGMPCYECGGMKQMGGIMSQDLEGTYPSFNQGGMEYMYGGDPSVSAISQKDYIKKFTGAMKMAMGGPSFPGETSDNIIENKKNLMLKTIANNVDNHLFEKVAMNSYQQAFGGLIKAKDGRTLNPYEDALDRQKMQQYGYPGPQQQYTPYPEFTNTMFPTTPQGTPSTDFGMVNTAVYKGQTPSNIQAPSTNNITMDPNQTKGMPAVTPKNPNAKTSSYTTWDGSINDQAFGVMGAFQLGTFMNNQAQSKKTQKEWERTHRGPEQSNVLNTYKNLGHYPDNAMFAGNPIDPYHSGYAQFTGDNVSSFYGGMGKYGGTMGRGGIATPNFWNASQQNWPVQMDKYSQPGIEVNNSLSAVPREEANLEAEGGETAIVNQGGIPAHFNIRGKKHTEGGVPLNLPENSFIFSDTKALKIKDPDILKEFGMGGSPGGYTPAEIAKKYNINQYRKILAEPDSTDLQRDTAEMMIANYNEKLAKLALLQESKKGFPQGIPAIAMPYIESMGINPQDMVNTQSQQDQPLADNMAKWGGDFADGGQYSIVNYLASKGMGHSKEERYKLAQKLGITDYDFSAKKNLELLAKMKGMEQRQNTPAHVQGIANEMQLEQRPSKMNIPMGNNIPMYMPAVGNMGTPTTPAYPMSNPFAEEDFYSTLSAPTFQEYGGLIKAQDGHIQLPMGDDIQSPMAVPTYISPRKQKPEEFMFPGTHEDPRLNQALNKIAHPSQSEGFWDYLGAMTSLPQKALFSPWSGAYEMPSETFKRVNKADMNFGFLADMATDPLMFMGPESATALAKLPYQVGKGATEAAVKYGPEVAKAVQKYGKQAVDAAVKFGAKTLEGIEAVITHPMFKTWAGNVGMKVVGAVSHGKQANDNSEKSVIDSYKQENQDLQNQLKLLTEGKIPASAIKQPSFQLPVQQVPATQVAVNKLPVAEDKYADLLNRIKSRKAYGGSYDGGGTFTSTSENLNGKFVPVRKYEDGSISVFENGKETFIQSANPDWKPTKGEPSRKAQGSNASKSPGEIDPYASPQLRKFLEENPYYKDRPELYTGKVAKRQGANPKGGYGKQDATGFLARNKDLMDQFKKEFGREYDKTKKSDVAWYQPAHRKQTIADARAAGFSEKDAAELADQISFKEGTGEGSPNDPRYMDLKHGDWTDTRTRFNFNKPEEIKAAVQQDPAKPGFVSPGIKPAPVHPGSEWWLQDKIGMAGAAADLWRTKKYAPWQATPGTYFADPTFLDPSRQIAANAEMANIGTQGLAAFTNPQQFNAGFSQIQGAGLKNAADIIGNYDNQNVNIANQFARERANTMNQASERNAGLATQLHDKYAIMNQQFDNSMGQRFDAIDNLAQNAVTNRAYTQNLNTLFPQYHIDPRSGGFKHHTGVESGFTGQEDANAESEYERLLKKFDKETAADIWKSKYSKTA